MAKNTNTENDVLNSCKQLIEKLTAGDISNDVFIALGVFLSAAVFLATTVIEQVLTGKEQDNGTKTDVG